MPDKINIVLVDTGRVETIVPKGDTPPTHTHTFQVIKTCCRAILEGQGRASPPT